MITKLEQWRADHRCGNCQFHGTMENCTNPKLAKDASRALDKMIRGGTCPHFEKKHKTFTAPHNGRGE